MLSIERPDQLKALGHPLRLRVLEMLGHGDEQHLTNRELAQRLGVDPGHLHFHVRMLLKAGLIERVDGGVGREKPYRAVARTVRVAPELVSSGLTSDLRATMLAEVQRGWDAYAQSGELRVAQITARVPMERALELVTELADEAREIDREAGDDVEPLVITIALHPPTNRER